MRRGIVFSVMVLLIVTLLIGMRDSDMDDSSSFRNALSENNAFERTMSKFDSIGANIVYLPQSGPEKNVQSRLLPFSYSYDGNKIYFSQKLPSSASVVLDYLEKLNAAAVFLESSDKNVYDGLLTDINAPTPSSWGGSAKKVSAQAMPQCLHYIYDENSVNFDFVCQSFGMADVKSIDVNISLKSTNDFNSLSCLFGQDAACPNQDYNSSAGLPYIRINLLDQNCTSCALSKTTVRSHFNPSQQNFVRVKCTGAACTSNPLDINFSSGLILNYSSIQFDALVLFDLNSNIDYLKGLDANISVRDSGFGTKVWN